MQAEEDRDRADVERLLETLDHPPPDATAASVIERARARAHRPAAQRWRWAASIVLAAVLGSVAWAAPGSPLPGWVAAARSALAGGKPAVVGASPIGAPDDAGLAVAPDAWMTIDIQAWTPPSALLVSLVDGPEVLVRAPSGAATFTSDADRLVVANVRAGTTVRIAIPRAAPRVEVRAGNRRLLLAERGRVSTTAELSTSGEYHIPLPAMAP